MDNKTKGKIILIGFKLDPIEKVMINNLIENYKKKILNKMGFEEIRLKIRKSARGKTFLHEVHGTLVQDKVFISKVTDYNLFAAIAETLDKLIHEAEHQERTRRQ